MCQTAFTEVNRPMQVTSPLGQDVLLLAGFTGQEGISQLFRFQLDLLARNRQEVAFEKFLGQPLTVQLADADEQCRYFNGIASRVFQGMSDDTFTSYHIQIVPRIWLLTNRAQCRIFQRLSVPEILRKVLEGFDVEYQIQGTFYPREYCVQYRETDFDFISRLMEEEGIYYFFKHTDGAHKLVLANTPPAHPDIPEPSTLVFHGAEEEPEEDGRNVYSWSKAQELRPGKYTLYDQHFEFPRRHLEAERVIHSAVEVGETNHRLR
ncbi:MAG: type VI secretion system tip protein VgrG, partial [Gemmataceae bacterium]|nr:type VI secretion system tip protein VgrG [Gemmataceae bacterium]